MIHDSGWFEMADKRIPRFAAASWVPLFARQQTSDLNTLSPGIGRNISTPWQSHFRQKNTGLIDELEWIHVSSPGNRPQIEGDSYLPASRFVHFNTQVAGDYLVLQNCFETGDEDEFLLDPDLILGLNLRREGESWVVPTRTIFRSSACTKELKGGLT